jgi:hypothetical protein
MVSLIEASTHESRLESTRAMYAFQGYKEEPDSAAMSQRAERDNKTLPAESRQTFLVEELLRGTIVRVISHVSFTRRLDHISISLS